MAGPPPFHQLLKSFLKSIPSFSAKAPPIPQTAAQTKIYSKLEAPYSNIGSKALQIEMT